MKRHDARYRLLFAVVGAQVACLAAVLSCGGTSVPTPPDAGPAGDAGADAASSSDGGGLDASPDADGATATDATPPDAAPGDAAPAPCTTGVCELFRGRGEHACALLQPGGVLKCWGRNDYGQLGLGERAGAPDTRNRGIAPGDMGAALPAVALGEPATAAAAGGLFTCALLRSETVSCWGSNYFGQLGRARFFEPGPTPQPIAELAGVKEVVTGGFHACARLANGTAKCWGDNEFGQLGTGSTGGYSETPSDVLQPGGGAPLTGVTQLAAGNRFTCALAAGAVYCWGYNDHGQLGVGNVDPSGTPQQVVALGTGITRVSLGGSHAMAEYPDAAVIAWGTNRLAGLGVPTTSTSAPDYGADGGPLPFVDLRPPPAELSLQDQGSCARFGDGSVTCWGPNSAGQNGLGRTDLSRGGGVGDLSTNLLLVDLGPGKRALQIAAAGNSACARLVGGEVKCWGHNLYGQLGQGDTTDRGRSPSDMGSALLPVPLQ